MKVLCTTQRTPEWFEAKRGKVSASDAHKCLMGRGTKGRRLYVEKIADDLEGIPDFADEDNPPWFTDGIYYEGFARGWYSFHRGVDVEQTGFVVHDEYGWLGCSPDDLVGDDGLAEYKHRKKLSTFKDAITATTRNRDIVQIQTQLFVTGRRWCDYVNYWRDDDNEIERGHVRRVYPDRSFVDNTLLPGLLSFWKDVQAELRRRQLQREQSHV